MPSCLSFCFKLALVDSESGGKPGLSPVVTRNMDRVGGAGSRRYECTSANALPELGKKD